MTTVATKHIKCDRCGIQQDINQAVPATGKWYQLEWHDVTNTVYYRIDVCAKCLIHMGMKRYMGEDAHNVNA